ncbi:hypothetical protein M1O20_00900 [Dehalococcoidia bacterium]|nr:hypothetical protein [Dehalococcoidia bacterium]
MSEIGARGEVKPDELDRIVSDSFLNSNPIAILEKYFCAANEQPDFFNHLSVLQGKVSEWDKGRVFDDKSEIRWEREEEEDGFHLVWIKDDGNIPEGWNKKVLKLMDVREILLWGERVGGKDEWFEKQVPRILEYPQNGNGSRVYMVINEYQIVDDDSRVYRFREVKTK